MNIFQDWAAAWPSIPPEAIADLQRRMCMAGDITTPDRKRPLDPASERYVEDLVVLEAADKDIHLWKNNVGVLENREGRPVRYGLANDSKALNEVLKSSDRIGIRKRVVMPWHVGQTWGIFVAREIKHGGWKFNPNDDHEAAQLRFGQLITAYGGDFSFATGVGTL